jgi:ribonuclease T1
VDGWSYHYAASNPVNYTDPDGLCPQGIDYFGPCHTQSFGGGGGIGGSGGGNPFSGITDRIRGALDRLFGRGVPARATDTLNYLRGNKYTPPLNYKGGKVWENNQNQLPAGGNYREFDVAPKVPGQPRTSERLVIDMNTGRAWYTPDHYGTFVEIP